MHNLTHVLFEDAKMFLAAVAEYNHVVHEENSEAGAGYAARELLPKGYFWDGWDKLREQYTQAVSSSGDQHPAVIGPVKSIPPELLNSRGLHPVAETATSSASSCHKRTGSCIKMSRAKGFLRQSSSKPPRA